MAEVMDAAPSSTEPAGGDFAGLEAQAAAIEGGGVPSAPGAPGEGAGNAAEELLAALTMARLILAPSMQWWDGFGQVWNDATLRGIADGGAAVMEKHGWTMGGLFAEWGPYFALIGATAPPAFATYQAIKYKKEKAAADERSKQAQD